MPKVVISGYYGFNNIGDEAILKGMIDGIKNLTEDAEIVVLSQHPEFTAKKHSVKSIKRMDIFSIIRELRSCDLLVSGGGSLFQDITSKRSILYYLGIIYLAKLFGKRVMVYSQGIGPVNIDYNRFFLKNIFNNIDFINVRDEKSKKELLDMGVNKDVLVTVDTVFGIKKPDIIVGKNIIKDLNIDPNKKLIGISIRPWQNTKDIVNEIKKVCENLVSKYDYEILFIPCHFYSDLKIMKEVLKNIDSNLKYKIHIVDKYLYVNEYLSIIGNLEFLIGMRLHALIFSVLMGIPVIGLSYDPKIDNFLSRVGKNKVLNVSNINFDDIINEANYLIANIDEERRNIECKRDELSKLANVHNEILVDLLNGNKSDKGRKTIDNCQLSINYTRWIMDKINVLGVPIDKVNMNEALNKAVDLLENKYQSVIYTPNSEIVMMAKEDKNLLNAIKESDLTIPDGIGLVLASKIIKNPLSERVTGIDLMENILKYCNSKGKSIYIVGGKPGTADKAGKNIKQKYPDINVLGTHHGYFKGYHIGMEGYEEEIEVLNEINSLKPDILFVAFGAPKQELWIKRYKNEINTKLFMGVGGSVDVYAGEVNRAPLMYQKLGLEWFYRLMKEPWRYKRMMALPKFVIEVLLNNKN